VKNKIHISRLILAILLIFSMLCPVKVFAVSTVPSAQSSGLDWFMLFIGLAGGLALFLYGMQIMSDGIRRSGGSGLRNLLEKLTRNRFVASVAGVFSTVMMQSSSALSVLLVGLVQAKMITFPNTVGVLLGSGIGSTVTAQLIAFKVTDYSLLFVAIGFFVILASGQGNYRKLGEAILGFGILFFGMQIMSETMSPLRTYQPFIDVLAKMQNPFLGILVGMLFTTIIQSSAAFVGIIILLSTQGLLTIESGIPLVLGSNIGTTITAQLASLGGSRDAKRVAVSFSLMKLIGVFIIIWWLPHFKDLTEWISPVGKCTSAECLAPRQIANAHTLFNVMVFLLLIPFTKAYTKFVNFLVPEKEVTKKEKFKVLHLNEGLMSTPALAIKTARDETLRMACLVREMMQIMLNPFIKKESNVLAVIKKKEKEVDFLYKRISGYLTELAKANSSKSVSHEVFQLMYSISELEEIADIIDNNLTARANDWLESGKCFSKEGIKELEEYHLQTMKQISRAIDLLSDTTADKAVHIKEKHKKIQRMAIEMKKNHFERLSASVPESTTSSSTHLHLMTIFRIINSHSTNIGRIGLNSFESEFFQELKN